MIRNVLIYTAPLCLLLFNGCQNNSSAPEASETRSPAAAPKPESPSFRFSKAPMPEADEAANWCEAHFDSPLVVNAEKERTNRRYFYLPEGITKVATGPTGAFGTFMLRPLGNGDVELFTSATLGYCLSNGKNFTPATGGRILEYNNHHNVNFTLELRQENGHPLITIEVPQENNYVLMANRCRDCKE